MKRISVFAVIMMSVVMLCSTVRGQGGSNETQNVTQLQLAKLMVQLCGLQPSLPTDRALTDADYFQVLAFNNIQPAGGWQSGQLASRADLARVVVQAMGESSKVTTPEEPGAWVDYLVNKGIKVDTIGLGSKPVEPLLFPLSVDPVVAIQNILNEVVKPIPPTTPTGPAKGARI